MATNTPLVVDDEAEFVALDDNISDTTSLASTILAYRQENGRTYHAYKDGSTSAGEFGPTRALANGLGSICPSKRSDRE